MTAEAAPGFTGVFPLAILICFQLLGEGFVRVTGLPVSGAVVGAVFLLLALVAVPSLHDRIASSCHRLINHMLLLFVPVSVGLMEHGEALRSQLGILVAVASVSTWVTALATASVFQWVDRWGLRSKRRRR